MKPIEATPPDVSGLDPALFDGGAGRHPWLVQLASDHGRAAGLDLADAVHWLSKLHGGAIGLVDGASLKAGGAAERSFLARAYEAWQCERRALTRLVVAVGPAPSTPGQIADDATVAGLSAAIATLATSERSGVALGAAAALVVEWHGLRALMNRAADRFTVTIPGCDLPSGVEVLATVAGLLDGPTTARAATFGARELIHQHGSLVELLRRRSTARQAM